MRRQPKKTKVVIDGENLTTQTISDIVNSPNKKIILSKKALKKTKLSFQFLQQTLKEKQNELIYGINTGFGPMASYILAPNQLIELQKNLIYSHAVGIGEPIKQEYSLAAMVVRLNTLLKGYSGVSPELVLHLQKIINLRIIPLIPRHGAVGTSGDLVQLAHIALVLIGGGEVHYKNKIQKTKDVYKKLKIKPYILKPKEGLSLINGTSVMAAISSLLVNEAESLLQNEVVLGALSLELVEAYSDSIAKKLHELRPHPGQLYISNQLREILKYSTLIKTRKEKTKHIKIQGKIQELPEAIQEVYSLRCISQILGPIYDIIQKVKKEVEIEINSVTDNPIVDVESKSFLHGGNFHGDYIAAAIDQMKASIIKLTMFSERRINFFLNNKINKKFPPFLNLKKPGLTLGLQGLQFVATSTTANNQSLGFPHHLHSIPTNGDNQDVVSMGTDASLIAHEVLQNTFIVQGIEVITLCQAVDFLRIQDKLVTKSRELFKFTRQYIKKITDDRELTEELQNYIQQLKSRGQLDLFK